MLALKKIDIHLFFGQHGTKQQKCVFFQKITLIYLPILALLQVSLNTLAFFCNNILWLLTSHLYAQGVLFIYIALGYESAFLT